MFEKRLKDRLNAEISKLTPDVKQWVVGSSYIEKPAPAATPRKKATYKRFLPAVISVCVIVALAVTGLAVYLTRDKDTYISNSTYMVMEIGNAAADATETFEGNPAVAFTADSDGKIESVRAENAEGEIILSSIKVTLVGKDLSEGAKTVVEAAAKLGYIDVTATAETSDAVIKISLTSAGKINNVKADVKANIVSYLKESGIYAFVDDLAYTKEEIVAKIQQFDKDASLSDSIEALNAKLAERKSYYEEQIAKESNLNTAIIKQYLAIAVENLNELAEQYPLLESYVNIIKNKLNTINTYIDIASDFAENMVATAKAAISTYIGNIIESAPDDIKNCISGYIAAIPDTVAELGNYIQAVCNRHAAELTATFKASFEASRTAISDADYAEFVKKF